MKNLVVVGLLLMTVVSSQLFASSLLSPIARQVRSPLLSVHRMVAIGYTAYSGQVARSWTADSAKDYIGDGYIFLEGNKLNNGTRVYAKFVDRSTSTIYITDGFYNAEQELVRLQGLAVLPSLGEELVPWWLRDYALKNGKLLTISATLEGVTSVFNFNDHGNNFYRVVRRQFAKNVITIVETITRNGYNPYVVFRHLAKMPSGSTEVLGEELSIGSYPFLAVNPTLVNAEVVASHGREVMSVGTLVSYQFRDDNYDLISDSLVWHEVEGNPGITGAGASTRLIEQLFNINSNQLYEAKIAGQLHSELPLGLFDRLEPR